MTLNITVQMEIDHDFQHNNIDQRRERKMTASATQAVINALRHAEDNGYQHTMSNDTALTFIKVSSVKHL